MHVGADDLVRRRNGARDAAFDLRRCDALGEHGKRFRHIVARLHLERRPVDGAAIETRRRAGFQTPEREARLLQRR